MARVLVTGAGGQIGSYVVDELLDGGHEVVAVGPFSARVPALAEEISAATADSLFHRAGAIDAVIHLAALSSVAASWDAPVETLVANTVTTAAIVRAMKRHCPRATLVHASSAEIFGRTDRAVQDELTPLNPVSPYGVSKAAAHTLVKIAREAEGLAASNVIFYLGESERRPPTFVFRKITRGVAKISLGLESSLTLGNVDVVRDFSHASDLARAACQIALAFPPGDYCCASGTGHSLREVVELACQTLGLPSENLLKIDRSLFRPTDIPSLIGSSEKLRALGWQPRVDFRGLVERLVHFDLAELRKEKEKGRL